MAKPVPIGTRAQIERVVEFDNTLTSHHSELPPVLTTPDMIALMETACFMATVDFCEDGEITVGTAINVTHRAPTGIGSKVTAEAALEEVDGRFHIFRVTARDEHQLIGEGTVHRAFVHLSRFIAKPGIRKD